MIYGQDAPIAFPVADLYDSGMMQMYANALRDQYNQGLKDYEDFIAKYGNFTSPFRKDVERWDNEVMGPTMNLIESLYAQGIDPTRNAEARAMIARSMRNVPYGDIAAMRQNAAAGEAYIKARGALAAKGLYDNDYNNFWLREQGYKPFEEWSSEDGIWNITSPIEYKSLFDATSPWFEKMKEHDLTPEQVAAAGYAYDPRYRYSGIPVEDLREVTGNSIPGFMNSIEGRYYRDVVSRRLRAQGIDPTDEAVNAALAEDIVTANRRVVVDPTARADEFAKLDYNAQLQEQQARRDHQRQLDLYNIRYGDDGSNGGGSGSGSGKGKKSHSHVFEMYSKGISQAAGMTEDEIYNPQITTMAFLNKQRSVLSANASGSGFMDAGAIYDSPGTIVKMFVGKKPNDDNSVTLNNDDVERLYTADAIKERAWTNSPTKTKQNAVDRLNKYSPWGGNKTVKDTANNSTIKLNDSYTYDMQPTGKTKNVYEKDGRMHTYVEVRVYSHQKIYKEDGQVKEGPANNGGTYWYDTHITSRKKLIPKREYGVKDGVGFIKINGRIVANGLPTINGKIDMTTVPDVGYFPQEQIDLTPDPKYDLERESMDVAMGRSMGDTASRNTEDARLD